MHEASSTTIIQSPPVRLNSVLLSDNPTQGDAQETGLIGRTRSSSHDSLDEDQAYTASKAVPVTPGIHTAGHSAYFEAKREPGEPDQHHAHPDDASPGPHWNANSYQAPKKDDEADASPNVAATDSKSAEEVLRQLKLAANGDSSKKELTDVDPRAAHPTLGLSGSIISATFVVPYSVAFAPDKEWVSAFVVLFQEVQLTRPAGAQVSTRYLCPL